MNPRHRKFERAVWRRIRAERRRLPALQAEFRRVGRRGWNRELPGWVWTLVLGGALAAGLGAMIQESGRVELGLAALAFWTLAVVGLQARRWSDVMHDGVDLAVWFQLPVSDGRIFDFQGRKFRKHLWLLALPHVPVGVALALAPGDGGWTRWLASGLLPLMQLGWATALAVHLEARWPGGWHGHLAKLALPSLFLVFVGKQLGVVADELVAAGWWLPPGGWLGYVYQRGIVEGDGWALGLLIPLAWIVATVPWSWRRLRAHYALPEPVWDPGAERGAWPAEVGLRAGPTALEEFVRAGGLGGTLDWRRSGWFERWAGAWLNPRERLVAEFMTARAPEWSRSVRAGVVLLGVSTALVYGVGGYATWVLIVGLLPALIGVLPLLSAAWRGFEPVPTGTLRMPMHALYPLGFFEITRVMWKVGTLRALVAGPALALLVAVVAGRCGLDWAQAWEIAAKSVGLILILQPALVVMKFAEGTGETQRLRLGFVALMVPVALAVGGLILGVFLTRDGGWAVAGLTALGFAAWGMRAVYGWAWRRGRFDQLGQFETE